jgi:hypothetical protein
MGQAGKGGNNNIDIFVWQKPRHAKEETRDNTVDGHADMLGPQAIRSG